MKMPAYEIGWPQPWSPLRKERKPEIVLNLNLKSPENIKNLQ